MPLPEWLEEQLKRQEEERRRRERPSALERLDTMMGGERRAEAPSKEHHSNPNEVEYYAEIIGLLDNERQAEADYKRLREKAKTISATDVSYLDKIIFDEELHANLLNVILRRAPIREVLEYRARRMKTVQLLR